MRLPVYSNQANIKVSDGIKIENSANAIYQATNNLGNAVQDLSVQWQKTQNEAESLDGKNKMVADIDDILNEAENFTEYKSPKELKEKERELSDRLNRVVPNIADGFTNDRNRENFNRAQKINALQNSERLKGVFRKKYIDNNNANLALSYDNNMRKFVETGNPTFRQSYLDDLDKSFKAGYLSEEQKVSNTKRSEEWEQYMVLRQAETDPEAVISNLKEGKYNVKLEDMNDLLKSLNTVKTNKHLMEKYEDAVKQDKGESDTTDFIYGTGTYDEKLQYINNMEFSGDVSGAFAQKARRAIHQFKPNAEKRMSNAQSMADILQRVYDLNDSSTDSAEYLNGIRSVRESVVDLHTSGDIITKDAVSLNNQINTATRARVSEATSSVGYQFSDAKDYFKSALPPEYQNEAIRDMFYLTQDINLEGKNEKEIAKIYKKKAIEVSENILKQNRLGAERAYQDITIKTNDQFISDLATKRGSNVEVINKDIDETAKKYGLTREQVINRLKGNI